jgi:TP901 family phage tail tape measure protein
MAKQLNVNLAFTADTSSAKAQIQSLQKSLQEISKMPGKGSSLFDDTELKAASQAALELQQHLNAAINVDTGKLDLSRFSTSIKASGKDLNTYYSQLMKIGDQGQEAFLKLAQSISTAEAPVTRVNKKLTEMGTVLKNTARWQLSSSILHGFMGSLQSAYGYAQDLNESLINIRIVTGQSSDEMAAFAEKANKAAQSLSTTTTAYTDAALIFYQQGLGDKEVEDRTNVVIKMAQATGDAATDVSSYMTAIWNNFDDGSESLEHYSDVITALGAATASSSSEIAEGLSKFSAVAETAGLSYEYATSALATVVAKTRESADTVGNAFKTIFARIQDLELGETLDDGTDLGTYSQALEKVGVDIKDTSGELKDMDTVLDELGDKWNTLSNDTQLAVAQAVAGTRQYTQLMALMNNWDYMKENLAVAEDSEGTLEEQAEIYAESWEAAQKRVKAAAQDIYQDLIDDDFFIGITNGFEKVLESVNSVVETMGGFKGVVSSVGSIFLSLYAQKMPQALENLKANFMVLTGQAQKLMVEVQNETTSKLKEIQDDPSSSLSYKTQAEGIAQVTAMQQKLIVNSKNMTEQEKTNYQARIQNVQAIYEEAEALAKENEAINKEIAASEQALQKQSSSVGSDLFNALEENSRKRDTLTAESTQAVKLSLDTSDYQKEFIKLNQETSEIFSQIQQRFQEFSSTISNEDIFGELGKKFALTEEEIKNLANEGIAALDDSIKNRLKNGVQLTTSEFKKLYGQLTSILALSDSMKSQSDMWSKTAKELKATGQSADEMREKMSLYIAEIEKVGKDQGLETQNEHLEKLKELINSNEQDAEKLANAFQTWQESLDEGKTSVFSQQIEVLTNKIETLKSFMTDVLNIDPSAIDKYEQNVTNGATATERLNNALRNGKATASSFQTGTFAMSTALTQLSSSLMSTYTLITSVKNAVKTLTDDSSTGIEQLGAAVTAISGVIMTYSTYQQLANTLGKADIVIKSGQAVATGTATAAQKALNFAMNEFPLIGVISAITAVGAALYALVSNINSIKEFFFGSEKETLSSKLKKSTSATKNFKKSLEDVQSEWDTLTSDLNDYQDAVDALAACQKGTEDWYSAIKNVNSEVQTLINKYPELAKYPLKMDDNGAFYIDQSAINEAEEKYTQRTNILAGAEALNQNRTTETKSQINKEDLINELKENIQLPQIFSSSEGGYLDASDDLYSLIVDKYVEDASIEDIVGSIEDQVTNSLLQSYAQEYLSSLKTWGDPEEIEKFIEDGLLSRNDFGEITINQGLSDEDLQAIAEAGYRSAMGMSDDELSEKEGFYTSTEWIEGLLTQDLQQFKDGMTTINEDFRSTILQYQSELEEGSTSILNLSKATVDSVLGSEDFYENADNKDTIAERASQIYNDLVDEYVGEYENQDWKDIQDKLFNNYLDQNALDSSKFQEQVSFNKKTGDATYTDEDGNEKTVTKQELIDLQAVTDAFEALPEEVESRIIDTISATDENVAKYAQNISEEGEIAQDSVVQLTEKASNAVNDFANDKNFSNATLGEMKSYLS